MSKPGHILKELGRNLSRYPGTALASLMSLTLLFLLFDLFWVAAGTSDVFYTRLLSDLEMEVFVSEEVSDSASQVLDKPIRAIEGVQTVNFISREDARERLEMLLGTDLLADYDSANPLPRSYMLLFDHAYLNTDEMARIENELTQMSGIADVYYSRLWLSKAEQTRNVFLNIGMVLGSLVLLTALISSANNVRLMAQIRTAGLQRMRILGAGRLFLALPFLFEGFLIGGLSAVSGWLLILYARQKVAFTRFEVIIPSLEDIAVYSVVAAFLGLISAYLGIRKMLR